MKLITWKETESLATKAKISAQETTPGHVFSSWLLILSITSNPAKDWFGTASFSAELFAVESNSTEASQPYETTQKSLAQTRIILKFGTSLIIELVKMPFSPLKIHKCILTLRNRNTLLND